MGRVENESGTELPQSKSMGRVENESGTELRVQSRWAESKMKAVPSYASKHAASSGVRVVVAHTAHTWRNRFRVAGTPLPSTRYSLRLAARPAPSPAPLAQQGQPGTQRHQPARLGKGLVLDRIGLSQIKAPTESVP
jgi:hypothetical protein